MVNQVECHPYLQQDELRAFCREHEIAVTAWSPIGKGRLLNDNTLVKLAEKYGKTPAQIVLRWHYQNDTITIPKSVTPSRIAENMQIFDFELSNEDMLEIKMINKNERYGQNPDNFHFDF